MSCRKRNRFTADSKAALFTATSPALAPSPALSRPSINTPEQMAKWILGVWPKHNRGGLRGSPRLLPTLPSTLGLHQIGRFHPATNSRSSSHRTALDSTQVVMPHPGKGTVTTPNVAGHRPAWSLERVRNAPFQKGPCPLHSLHESQMSPRPTAHEGPGRPTHPHPREEGDLLVSTAKGHLTCS